MVKSKANTWILSKNLNFFKTYKNLYTRPMCIIDMKYEGHRQEIQSFGQFLPQTSVYGKIECQLRSILSKKLKKIKAHKNLYTTPSCVTDLKYQGNVQEIRTFSQFLEKPVFSVKPKSTTLLF
jgi:HSP90 family molecular chaperone